MPRTKRGLKKNHSEKALALKQTRFTVIVNRQRGLCWYCEDVMGADCTREHLLSQSRGGTNTYPPDNLKATHAECNLVVGHLPVVAKLRLRDIALRHGRREMFLMAKRMRRAEARMAFG